MKWLPLPSEPSCSRQFGAMALGVVRAVLARTARRSAASVSVVVDGSVVVPGRQRDGGSIASRSVVRLPRAACRSAGELSPDGDHAAADVHADRCRDDRAERRDHRSDRRALAVMRVGHQRQVREDERHRGGPLGLLAGVRLQDRCPVHQPLADLLHHNPFFPWPYEMVSKKPGMSERISPRRTRGPTGTRTL